MDNLATTSLLTDQHIQFAEETPLFFADTFQLNENSRYNILVENKLSLLAISGTFD